MINFIYLRKEIKKKNAVQFFLVLLVLAFNATAFQVLCTWVLKYKKLKNSENIRLFIMTLFSVLIACGLMIKSSGCIMWYHIREMQACMLLATFHWLFHNLKPLQTAPLLCTSIWLDSTLCVCVCVLIFLTETFLWPFSLPVCCTHDRSCCRSMIVLVAGLWLFPSSLSWLVLKVLSVSVNQ